MEADLNELLTPALWVAMKGDVKTCRDPDDNVILECARNATAQVIITGDSDLLARREFEGIRIITVDEFFVR